MTWMLLLIISIQTIYDYLREEKSHWAVTTRTTIFFNSIPKFHHVHTVQFMSLWYRELSMVLC